MIRPLWPLVLLCLLLPLSVGSAGAEEGPGFDVPIRCTLGEECFVMHHVDTDPGPGSADYTCGSLTYDGHTGTDIRTRTLQQMRDGVDVLAAAPGRVLRLRDGMADISVVKLGRDAVKNRRAGNSIIIDHGGGWQTQYAHLKRGSLKVRPGDRVEAGDVIAQVGLSGDTNFPHLHFTVRRNGETLDPFTGLAMGSGCGKSAGSLWSDEAQRALAYRPGGLLTSGFAASPPPYPELLDVGVEQEITRQSPALIAWMVVWGAREGDRWSIRIVGPSAKTIVAQEMRQPEDDNQHFWFVGRKRPPGGWPAGIYRARLRLIRPVGTSTTILADQEQVVTID